MHMLYVLHDGDYLHAYLRMCVLLRDARDAE